MSETTIFFMSMPPPPPTTRLKWCRATKLTTKLKDTPMPAISLLSKEATLPTKYLTPDPDTSNLKQARTRLSAARCAGRQTSLRRER